MVATLKINIVVHTTKEFVVNDFGRRVFDQDVTSYVSLQNFGEVLLSKVYVVMSNRRQITKEVKLTHQKIKSNNLETPSFVMG